MIRCLSIRVLLAFAYCAAFPPLVLAEEGPVPKAQPDGGAVPGGAVPGGAVPGGAVPGDSAPDDSAPDTEPMATTSSQTTPTAQSPKRVTLRGLLHSENPRERAAGIQFVVRKKVLRASPRLEEIAQTDENPGIRRLACMALGELQIKAAMLTLRTVARTDSSDGVRQAAKDALDKLGGTLEEEKAAGLLDKPPEAIQQAAQPQPPDAVEKKCKNNRDCQDPEVCTNAKCAKPTRQPTTGWALEASIIGFVGSAATLGLNIYSALEPQDLLPAIPLAASATLVTIIVAPSVRSGSKSVRDKSGVPGSLTLRVVGWMCFGLHIGGSLALATAIPFHWLKKTRGGEKWTPKTSWIMSNGVVGAVSLLTLSIEALVARSQAKRLIAVQKTRSRGQVQGPLTAPSNPEKPHPPEGLEKIQPPSPQPAQKSPTISLAPYLNPIVYRDRAAGAAFGLVGRF